MPSPVAATPRSPSAPWRPDADGTAGVSGRILVPVLLTVHGEGDLTRRPVFERAALFLEQDGRLGGRVAVHNDGNVHVPLTGSFELSVR